MELSHVYVLGLAAAATVLLALEKAQLSVVGIALIIAVAVPELVDANAAVAGFSNTAVVTVAALYIVGEGFGRTGAASILANRILAGTNGSESLVVLLIMVMAAVLSAFVNNILVVLAFLPVITSICRETGLYPSRLLIPLSYASILGGMCTLVGTSTNLLVSGVLEDNGLAGIGMFEMSAAGIVLTSIGIVFIGFLGRYLLPRVPSLAAQPGAADLHEYVTEITVGERSPFIGCGIAELADTHKLRVAMIVRKEKVVRPPFRDIEIQAGDILAVAGKIHAVADLHHSPAHSDQTDRYHPGSMSFFELSITPGSSMIGRRIVDLHIKQRFDAVVVGVLRGGHHLQQRFADLQLRAGDVLLAFGDDSSKERLRVSGDYNLLEGVDDKLYRRDKAPIAALIILAVIAMFVTQAVHYCIAALIGALLMVLTGCLTVRQANRAVNWPIIIFIAGTLALSKALVATGADRAIAQILNDTVSWLGPTGILAGIYFGTILLTELLSNNAVAVIMTPVALQAADIAEVDTRLLVMAVVFGASNSFANPWGYRTNLMVYGPGGYRFGHFLRIGLPLDIVLATLGIIILPWFF